MSWGTENNAARADRARVALAAYAQVNGVDPDELTVDLITDLLHFAEQNPTSPGEGGEAVALRALLHFSEEVE